MGPDELKEWKNRKAHADREWKDAGLIPDEEGSASDYYCMMRYLDAYRGDFPDVLSGGMDHADQMAGNITFSLVNTMVSQNSGGTPDPILRPIGGTAAGKDARRRAFLNEQVMRSIMREKKFKQEVDPAIMSAVLTGGGFVRHGFTPEVEYEDDNGVLIQRFKNQTPDMPWIQMMRPWQLRIDPIVNSFNPDGEPRWVAFQNLWFASQIKKNPNLVFRKDLVPTFYQDLRPKENRMGSSRPPAEDEVMPMYEEWVIYDFDERKFFGISPGSDQLIRPEADWPVDWGQLPYSYISFNSQLDSPFPIPFMRMIYDDQMMYNKIWTILNAVVSRTRRILAYNGNAMDDDQIAMLTNPRNFVEAIETQSDPREAIADLGFGSFDGQLVGLLFQLKEQIREVLGVSNFDRGQRANVETASEANQIGAGGAIARNRNQEKVEGFWENIIKVSHRSFLQNSDAREQIIPIIGRQNLNFLTQSERADGFLKTSLGEIRGEFDYAIRANSTMKIDPAQELAAVTTAYNTLGGQQSRMLDQRYFHERILELVGEDPLQAVLSEEVLQRQNQIEAQQSQDSDGGGAPDGGPAAAAQQGLPDLRSLSGGQ